MHRIFAYPAFAVFALAAGLASAAAASETAVRPADEINLAGISGSALGALHRSQLGLEQKIGGEEDARRALESRLRAAAEGYRRDIARARRAIPLAARADDPRIVAAWQATRARLQTIEDLKDRMRSLALRLEDSRSSARALAAMAAAQRVLPETASERGSVESIARRAGRLAAACETAIASLEAADRRWNAILLATRPVVEMLSTKVGAGLPPGVVLAEPVI